MTNQDQRGGPVVSRRRMLVLLGGLGAALLTGCGTTENTPVGATGPTATMDGMDMTATTGAGAGSTTVITPPTMTASSGANAVEITATLREWALDISQEEVAAGPVRFVVTNNGQFAHNFSVRVGNDAPISRTANFTGADGPQIVELELAPATYVLYCALPGHEQQGQRNELVVR